VDAVLAVLAVVVVVVSTAVLVERAAGGNCERSDVGEGHCSVEVLL
jgi:hypothetical protein